MGLCGNFYRNTVVVIGGNGEVVITAGRYLYYCLAA